MNELLILVNENDEELGEMDKMSVHRQGLLHRAFSVFVFTTDGKMLLQQRADEKYHSPGLWSNTCCSHPVKGESLADTMNRRLNEEMGMHCELDFKFSFIYKAELENNLIEHELDHVYFGLTDDRPVPNPSEVKAWKYMDLTELETDIRLNPGNYSAWLAICLPKVLEQFRHKLKE